MIEPVYGDCTHCTCGSGNGTLVVTYDREKNMGMLPQAEPMRFFPVPVLPPQSPVVVETPPPNGIREAPYVLVGAVPGHQTVRLARRVIRRNEPCPCGSGKKFKTCHRIDRSNES